MKKRNAMRLGVLALISALGVSLFLAASAFQQSKANGAAIDDLRSSMKPLQDEANFEESARALYGWGNAEGKALPPFIAAITSVDKETVDSYVTAQNSAGAKSNLMPDPQLGIRYAGAGFVAAYKGQMLLITAAHVYDAIISDPAREATAVFLNGLATTLLRPYLLSKKYDLAVWHIGSEEKWRAALSAEGDPIDAFAFMRIEQSSTLPRSEYPALVLGVRYDPVSTVPFTLDERSMTITPSGVSPIVTSSDPLPDGYLYATGSIPGNSGAAALVLCKDSKPCLGGVVEMNLAILSASKLSELLDEAMPSP